MENAQRNLMEEIDELNALSELASEESAILRVENSEDKINELPPPMKRRLSRAQSVRMLSQRPEDDEDMAAPPSPEASAAPKFKRNKDKIREKTKNKNDESRQAVTLALYS